MGWYGGGGYWAPYVPVAQKIANAKKAAEKLGKKGIDIQPVELSGRKIATSFWGKAWCDHMESFHDFENRLPRGRSYVRNGSVVHLDVSKGLIKALVAGSETYTVEIKVDLLPRPDWERMKRECAGQISSLLDLLKGTLSDGVMHIVTARKTGLFPGPDEFEMSCSCPDYAYMCKHIAAVLYGVGARLDQQPELLFLLRGVDHAELAVDGGVEAVINNTAGDGEQLASADLSDIFGIELIGQDDAPVQSDKPVKGNSRRGKKTGVTGKAKPKRATGAKKKPVAPKEPPKAAKAAKAPKKRARQPKPVKDRDAERLDRVLAMVKDYAKSKKPQK